MPEAAHTPRVDTSAPPVCFGTEADVYAFNDAAGSELDAVVDAQDGRWIVVEVELGGSATLNGRRSPC